MDDTELARIRAQRMAQIQANQRPREEANEEARQRSEQMKSQILQQILTQEARARLAMVEMTKPEMAELAVQTILRMTGAGSSPTKVTDEDMKAVLERLSTNMQKRETKVTFNRRRAGLDSDDEDY